MSVGFSAEVGLASGTVRPVGLYGTLGFWDNRIRLDFGQQRVAYSLYRQTSARFQQLTDPSDDQPTAFSLQSRREPGLRIRAEIPFAKEGLLRWYVSMTNGDGTNNFQNSDSKFYYSTFIDVAPLGDPGWAPADLENSDPLFSVGGSAGYNQSVGPTNPEFGAAGEQIRLAGHGRFKFRGFSLRGEYFHVREEVENTNDPTYYRGGMIQAGYVLPVPDFPQIEVAARYQRFNLDDEANGFDAINTPTPTSPTEFDFERMKTQLFEFGLNLYFLDHRAKLMFNYRITDITDKTYDYEEGGETFEREISDKLIGNRLFVTLQVGAF
jgi:hypothetical protein